MQIPIISIMSLIPSESQSFPDHFRQEIDRPRTPVAKILPSVAEPAQPRCRRSFFRLIRQFLATRAENIFPSTALPEPSHEEGLRALRTPPVRRESDVFASTAKPDASSEGASLSAASTSQAINGNGVTAQISVPAKKLPFRKSAVPPGLKRKARWNMRATSSQPAPAALNGASTDGQAKIPAQKIALKAARRPMTSPHFVQSAPPNLVQALLSYAAKASVSAPDSATAAPNGDVHFDNPQM